MVYSKLNTSFFISYLGCGWAFCFLPSQAVDQAFPSSSFLCLFLVAVVLFFGGFFFPTTLVYVSEYDDAEPLLWNSAAHNCTPKSSLHLNQTCTSPQDSLIHPGYWEQRLMRAQSQTAPRHCLRAPDTNLSGIPNKRGIGLGVCAVAPLHSAAQTTDSKSLVPARHQCWLGCAWHQAASLFVCITFKLF